MRQLRSVILWGLLLVVSPCGFLEAVEIYNGNGHAYDVISASLSWTGAKAAAESLPPPPGFTQGHLVTYTDNNEELFVIATFGSSTLNAKWIGFTDRVLEGEWRWIDETPGIWQDPDNFASPIQTAYTNWRTSTGEPNNEFNEDYAVYSTFMAPLAQWNDLPNTAGAFNGYVVEFEPNDLVILTSVSAILLGEPLSLQFEAAGGDDPYSWIVVFGSLPQGMSLNLDGVFNGTPTELGESTFTVRVTDRSSDFADKEFTVAVVLVLPPPDIRITKVGTTPVPGRTLEYFIVVQNAGDTIASGVTVSELLEPWFTLVSTDPAATSITTAFDPFPADLPDPSYDALVEWVIPQLDPGQVKLLAYSVILDPTFPIGEFVTGLVCIPTLPEAEKCSDDYFSCLVGVAAACAVAPTGAKKACIISGAAGCGAVYFFCMGKASLSCDADKKASTRPVDPNEKCVVAEKFIQPNQLLVYPIHFENIGEIEALDVFVTDVLDANLDDSTLEILSVGGSYDLTTRTLSWDLIGINLQPKETGSVLFSINPINPVSGLPSGTVIQNSAEIKFEIFDIVSTRLCGSELDEPQPVVNIIDTTPPSCQMTPLPSETESLDFAISWTGTDAIGEIASYSVFVSQDGSGFTPFLQGSSDTATTFSGEAETTYGFFCVAVDTADNVEVQDPVAEATTHTCVDGDGDRSCAIADCDDADGTVFPNAPEINDGKDNQCPGDAGHGVIDEVSGQFGFNTPDSTSTLSWDTQLNATSYGVARSTSSDMFTDCSNSIITNPNFVDVDNPAPGNAFYYLVRVESPFRGSWGQDFSGVERTFLCPPSVP